MVKIYADCSRVSSIYLPEFAAKIKPEWTRCHKLSDPPPSITQYFTAYDPISGLSIRVIRHWDVMKSDFRYRFDAAFS